MGVDLSLIFSLAQGDPEPLICSDEPSSRYKPPPGLVNCLSSYKPPLDQSSGSGAQSDNYECLIEGNEIFFEEFRTYLAQV